MNSAERAKLDKMQQEAARRAREMQQRAVPSVDGVPPMPNFVRTPYTAHSGAVPPTKEPPPPRPPVQKPPQQPPPPTKGLHLLRMLNFGQMKLDKDLLLILMLLLLLASENTDELLLLALVYVML